MAVTNFNESTYLQDNPDEEQQLLQYVAVGENRALLALIPTPPRLAAMQEDSQVPVLVTSST